MSAPKPTIKSALGYGYILRVKIDAYRDWVYAGKFSDCCEALRERAWENAPSPA
jgi:hypothetical protein